MCIRIAAAVCGCSGYDLAAALLVPHDGHALDPTLPVWLHQGVAAKLVRLKGLLPQTDVPALVARHTGLLSTDPAAMAASLDALRCTGHLEKTMRQHELFTSGLK